MQQHQPPSNEEVLAIAKRRGYFRVSHRFRDDSLRRRCRRMARKGLLWVMSYKEVRDIAHDDPRSATFYTYVEQQRTADSALS